MNTQTSQTTARVNLGLTKRELANLRLPPVTTVTFYSGTAPVQSLRHRIALNWRKPVADVAHREEVHDH